MVLAGAASIWLFYLLLRRTVGERAAVVGCCLLAADTMYLLTSVFDWGPVALQHLLLTAGMLLMVRFYQQGSERAMAFGFFLFGLALWDKALAAWMLSGMGIAAVLVFWRELWKVARPRRIAIAALAFLLGALPLLVYNRASHWETFRGNVKPDNSELPGKIEVMRQTVSGRGLVGLFTEETRPAPLPHPPSGFFQKASAALAEATGHPLQNLTLYGLLLALLLTPLARGRDLRAALFAWIALAVAWCGMLFTFHAGGSVHHTILLWPLPYMAMSVPMAAASRRIGLAGLPALAAAAALLIGSNVLVTNEYYNRMERQGGATPWTDAIGKLADYLKGAPLVFCVDWGILDNLRLISHGRLLLRDGTEHTMRPEPTPEDREAVRQMFTIPGALFVGHTKDAEMFPGDTARLLRIANDAGVGTELLATIPDSFGRPTFEIYRFSPAP
jgi:4-amino-4-deoxy-L-arabinose transferase-like glycosyltransferase